MRRARSITLLQFLVIALCIVTVSVTAVTYIISTNVYRVSLTKAASLDTLRISEQTAHTIEIYAREAKDNLKLLEKELQQTQNRNEVIEYIHSMVSIQRNTVSITIYGADGSILECSAGTMLKGNVTSDPSFMPEMFEKNSYEFSAPHLQNIFRNYNPWVVTIGNRLLLIRNIYNQKVYLTMDIRIFSILSHVDSVRIGQLGYCFIIDANGKIIYHPSSDGELNDYAYVCSLPDGVHMPGDGTVVALKAIEGTPWRVVSVSYIEELVDEKLDDMHKDMLLGVSVCLVLVFVGIYLFTKLMADPLKELAQNMQTFDLNAELPEQGKKRFIWEAKVLTESFSNMAERIKMLVEKVKEEETIHRKAELKSLQSQINPHFLYNTLDSIMWMCEHSEMQAAVKMIGALARFFRISLSRGAELIPIEMEMEHAKNYLIIQSFRYGDDFTYRFEMSDDVSFCLCNKICLQPLIENSIIHGFGEYCDEGEMVISALEEDGNIVLRVTDNGVGMTAEKKEEIEKNLTESGSGFGLKNVNDRVRFFFGPQYGISVDSEQDVGTTVTITIPKVTSYKSLDT
ncbi:MAG: sensor histidine kinase [Clostridiales bacterium]|nr:sensor histidine kinase [Clostridiales bacterium]